MPRSFRKSWILLVAVLVAPACGGQEEADGLEVRTEAISWSPGRFVLPRDYLFFSSQVRNAANADFFCAVNGGTLAVMNSAAEQAFVANQIVLHGGGSWWLGYSDSDTEGFWKGADGSTAGYVNWAPGQPANVTGNEDCAAVDGSTGLWSALDCGAGLNFVCERGPFVPTSTGTFPYSATNTSSDTLNYTAFAVGVKFGLTVGTCGLANASNTGDTFLRVFDQNGVELAANDDACGTSNLASNVTIDTYSCPNGCSYIIHAGCYAATSCAGTVSYEQF